MTDTKDTRARTKTRWRAVLITALLVGGASVGSTYYVLTQNPEQDLQWLKSVAGFSDKTKAQAGTQAPDTILTAPESNPVLTNVPVEPAVPASNTDAAPVPDIRTLPPELRQVIEAAKILQEGESSQDWAQKNLGYIPKGKPGDVIPGMEKVQAIPDSWIVGDSESEGGGETVPNDFPVNGKVSFKDNGHLQVNGTDILLSGILLPQAGGNCTSASGEPYDCQAWAVAGLRTHIEGKMAFCSVSEVNGTNYGLCDVLIGEDGKAIDLASWMVSAGIAVPHDVPAPSLYREQEMDAKENKLGLWSGTFAFRENADVASKPEP